MNNPHHFRPSNSTTLLPGGQLAIPLLEMNLEDDNLAAPVDKHRERVPKDLAAYSMLIGICIGSLLHLATLGGSFVLLSSLGVETSAGLLSFGLSFAITLIAVTLSSAVRLLLGFALKTSTGVTPSDGDLAYVRLCNLLGLVTGIFVAAVSMESLMNWNSSHFLLHTVALLVWVVTATTLAATERSFKANLIEQPLIEKDFIEENSGRTDFSV